MTKIVPFIRSSRTSSHQTREHGLDSFVDNGDLLEFSEPDKSQADGTIQAHNQARNFAYASDWSNQELADLYRAHALVQAAQPGLECDRGLSDENDPWFLIGDDQGDVFVHICRIKGTYILDSAALPEPLRGKNFNALIDSFLANVAGETSEDTDIVQESANVVRLGRGGTVCLHPSVMIAALIWTLLVNADELTLPPSSGSTQKPLDQGQDQGVKLSDSDKDGEAANILAPEAPNESLVESETIPTASDSLDAKASTAPTAQKDEKQLHISAYSHALTAIAIAAGFYASSEAGNVFWKTTQALADTSVSFDETEAGEGQEQLTSFDYLSGVITLLNSAVDLVVFESSEDYETALRNSSNDDTNTLMASSTEAMNVSIGQQMLALAGQVLRDLAKSAENRVADTSSETSTDAASALQADIATFLDENGLKASASDIYFASLADAYASYAARDTDVIYYDASSLQAGLGEFGGELEKYSEVFESAADKGTYHITSGATPEIEGGFNSSQSFNEFDDAARQFIDAKLASGDLEMLVFENEIIFVGTATFSNDSTVVSWQLDDGGVISVIGLPSEIDTFLMV